jgi:hypothetical protein
VKNAISAAPARTTALSSGWTKSANKPVIANPRITLVTIALSASAGSSSVRLTASNDSGAYRARITGEALIIHFPRLEVMTVPYLRLCCKS